ncbi:hypothetical protein CBS63078_8794 [Aspergillus niger]|uniref:Amidase family protein n=3 Tax=Aspergillus TaxID=5052 RepID=A0A254TZX2_ASPNG|nr:hypothetical protein ASPNIDRAFT_206381 [Aspergillus niger ATCC 1015]KAI2894326.1 hypothetical protein CBS63078_8794 [Aspergillus niger]RDK46605.1 hypothetical protein M752DRAFT_104206 [Aspergillus phoenicis ATCC 13157]KAI2966048.1 hypothetical protein CBS147323_5588 [Aspergillus niger]KAI2999377.1 hypothetical protein CBS147346_7680 [Aspergillus niger]
MSTVHWPHRFLPGTTENFVSNEIYVPQLTASRVWPNLITPSRWTSYYSNVDEVTPPPTSDATFQNPGDKFSFATFGFPPLQAEICECVAPTANSPGRLAWRAWQEGDEETALEVYHAWIVEDMKWGVVRILTQEVQAGKPAAGLAEKKPNPMLLGHQEWVDGLARFSLEN